MIDSIEIPTESLPLWMRRARQSVDWGILIVLFFSMIAAWPFIIQSGLPHSNAAENHVYAAADYAQAFREGVLYPRWSATAADGYGAPIYNFAPPGLSYLAGSIEALFTNHDSTVAMRLVLVGAFLFAGAMTYVLMLRISGAIAGIVAATLYVFSPYIGLTAPHLLGDYPAVLSFALIPMLLWSVTRSLTLRHPLDSAITALTVAAFLLVDPPALLPALGLVALVTLWAILIGRTGGLLAVVRKLTRLIVALGIGAGLAALFWWPSLHEQDYVTWTPATVQTPDYALSLRELFTPPVVIDLNEQAPAPQFKLGLALIVFNALAPVIILRELRHKRRHLLGHGLFFLAGIALLVIGVWRFPDETGLLGAMSLCFALSGSAVIEIRHSLKPGFARLPLPVALMTILALSTAVWLAPRWSSPFGETDQNVMLHHELAGYGVAVLPTGESVPLTVESPIYPNAELLASYAQGAPIRIPNVRLTGEKRANFVSTGTHYDRYVIDARDTAIFDILRAYDPAWTATLNGESLPLSPNLANGLMQVQVPAVTDGLLILSYGATPARAQGWLISGIALLILVIWMTNSLLRFHSDERFDDLIYIPVSDARLIGVLCAGFLAILALFVMPSSSGTLYPRSGYGIDHYIALEATTAQGLEVLAYARPGQAAYRMGDTLEIMLVWRANDPIRANYHVQVFLLGSQPNFRWALGVPHDPAYIPTSRWEAGRYLRETIRIPLESLVHGDYRVALEIGVCDESACNSQSLLTFYQDTAPIGSRLTLPFIVSVDY